MLHSWLRLRLGKVLSSDRPERQLEIIVGSQPITIFQRTMRT